MTPPLRRSLDAWADALLARHLAAFTTPEFLRAARALSVRYVEDRRGLTTRSALDSAGKRAAFAVLYGPIHYAITRGIAQGLRLHTRPVTRIVDLGCGTGAASAGWASLCSPPPAIDGVDRQGWAVEEAAWTWRTLAAHGRARRADLAAAAERLAAPGRRLPDTGILAAWSVNELAPNPRDTLLDCLLTLGTRGAQVLVVEPIAERIVPWWHQWAAAVLSAGGRADEWRLPNALPEALRRLDREAGFDRPTLTARSLLLPAERLDTRVLPSTSNE